ncbi:MAG: hypothetical protein ACFFAT_12150 [Promethearchaeota archaeon]
MSNKKSKIKFILYSSIFVLIFIGNIFMINISINYQNQLDNDSNQADLLLRNSAGTYKQYFLDQEWLTNNGFDSGTTNWTESLVDANNDLNVFYESGVAGFEVLGDEGSYTYNEIPTYSDWGDSIDNPYTDFGPPDNVDISDGFSNGAYLYHKWDDGYPDPQHAGTFWRMDVSTDDNISDYEIVSAELSAHVSSSSGGNLEANDKGMLYVILTDPSETYRYKVAERTFYQSTYTNYPMFVVNESVLISVLESVLNEDKQNFAMFIGIESEFVDDDIGYDDDTWNYLRIDRVSLNFTYKKVINYESAVSWNQKGNALPSGSTVTEAKVFLEYMINDTWPASSPNSEIIVYINDDPYIETIELKDATTSFQNVTFDVTSRILNDIEINITIELLINDNFNLSKTIKVSLDNIYLNITYYKELNEIDTDYQLLLDNQDKTLIRSHDTSINEIVNITFIFENSSGEFIAGANVTILGPGYDIVDLNEASDYYYILINTSSIGFGDTVFKIEASKYTYTTIEISLTIRVNSRTAYLDEDNIYLEDIKRTEYYSHFSGDDLNITCKYIDQITNETVLNSTVQLLRIVNKASVNIGNFSYVPMIDSYYLNLNTSSISEGVYVYTIYAEKTNYTSSTVQIIIGINVKDATMEILVNGFNVTDVNTPQINITIGEPINITARAYDVNTSAYIGNAEFKAIAPDNTEYVFDESPSTYYNYTIDSLSAFNFYGTRFLYVSFNHPNYNTLVKDMLIKLDPLTFKIVPLSGSTVLEYITGQSVKIELYLNDTYFNQPIVGADVSYKWRFTDDYVQMTDNGDGTYEVILGVLAADVYTIDIRVDAGFNYEIEREEYTVVVKLSTQDEFLLNLVRILIIVGVVGTIGFSSYIYAYQKVLKYPKPVRKVRKFKSKLRKKGGVSTDFVPREKSFEESFKNNLGITGKSIKGKIEIYQPDQYIPTSKNIEEGSKITKDKPNKS